jgi:hypothetical protein
MPERMPERPQTHPLVPPDFDPAIDMPVFVNGYRVSPGPSGVYRRVMLPGIGVVQERIDTSNFETTTPVSNIPRPKLNIDGVPYNL